MSIGINPSQALNLGGQPSAYGDTFNAINLFKGADAWIILGADGQEIRNQVAVDSRGWPTELPLINGEVQTIWANVFYTKILPPGNYIVEWEGETQLETWQTAERLGPNKYRIKYEANNSQGDDGITLRIDASNPANAKIDLRNVKVYNEKYSDLIAMGETFDPEWFQAVDDFRILRTHDWQGTNYAKVTDWTLQDQTADQAFWTSSRAGVPYEILVKIANETRSDLWINIPHMATDDYMRKAAAYVKQHLDKDLRVYVEYTNEYWTDIFDQHPYLIQKGEEKFGDAPFSLAQAYGARASEMTQIFNEVFGSEQARLYPTVTVDDRFFTTKEALSMLTTPAYVAQGGTSPLDAGIRHIATDGYFGWYTPDPSTERMLDSWISQGKVGYAKVVDYLITQIKTELAPNWAKGKALAAKYDLSFGVYEGGALLINGQSLPTQNSKYTAFNERVQISAEMKRAYETMLPLWEKYGTEAFAWYSDTGRWGPWGDYGLWNAPDFVPEIRTTAIIDANAEVDPWWKSDSRGARTFDNGLYDRGSDADDVIQGTRMADRIYGLDGRDTLRGEAGNDILVGGKGIDRLSGGDGNDTLVGGSSADDLNGGAGFDFASFRTSLTGVTADLQNASTNTGDARGDRYAGIQGLLGSESRDMLRGDAAGNWLDGRGGNDVLSGRDGSDRLKGGLGNDTLKGGSGRDIFYLGPGRDTVIDLQQGDKLAVSTSGWGFGDPGPVQIIQSGADTVITLTTQPDWSLTLKSTNAATIKISDDFLFS
jgi:hypothetical protein